MTETIGRKAVELDETLMHGIHAVRRTSENITKQSLKAIEGLWRERSDIGRTRAYVRSLRRSTRRTGSRRP
jgi:hypothetical protein